jgi:hypothetical protein
MHAKGKLFAEIADNHVAQVAGKQALNQPGNGPD